jgi:hypothetical protein
VIIMYVDKYLRHLVATTRQVDACMWMDACGWLVHS